jgi:hypothetical protein
LLVFAATALAAQAKSGPPYAVVQILPITVQPGVTVPADYTDELAERIVQGLEQSKRFTTVVQSADVSTAPAQPTLRIATTVTRFVPGNRAERYLVGFGAGATKMSVHLVFTDGITSKVLLEKDVKGLTWIGLLGGSSKGAQKDISKDIRSVVVENF